MMWFHGGGFLAGSGSDDLYAPDNLLDHDIILVAANYRLGKLCMPLTPNVMYGLVCLLLATRSIGIFEFGPKRLSWQFRFERPSGSVEMGE